MEPKDLQQFLDQFAKSGFYDSNGNYTYTAADTRDLYKIFSALIQDTESNNIADEFGVTLSLQHECVSYANDTFYIDLDKCPQKTYERLKDKISVRLRNETTNTSKLCTWNESVGRYEVLLENRKIPVILVYSI